MTLEEAIQQQIALGKKDPLQIARKIEKEHGPDWLSKELLALSEEIIANIARLRLGAMRRSTQLAVRENPGDAMLASTWVPDHGWKRLADMTLGDVEKTAAWYRRLASGSLVRAHWFEAIAAEMKRAAVDTVKALGVLPGLPPREELTA